MGLSPLPPFASDSVVKHLIPLWELWLLVEPGDTCCDMCVSIVSHNHSSTRAVVSALFLQIEVECATANMLSSHRNLSSKCAISMHMYCLPWMGDNGVVGSIIIVLYIILRLWYRIVSQTLCKASHLYQKETLQNTGFKAVLPEQKPFY